MRRATISAAVLLAGLLAPVALATPGLAQDNSAVAVNTKDDSSVFKFAFSIKQVAGDVVDPQNAAVAYASCDGCQTVAVAIQVVLVSGDPEVVAPENVAIAYNQDCSLCATLAMAYQFVFGTGDEPVHFSQEGRARLHEIKKQLKELKHADLSLEEMQARVDALAEQVNEVVINEIVTGPPGQAKQQDATTTTTRAATTDTTSPPTTAPTTTSPPTTTSSSTSDTSTPTTAAPASTTSTSIP